MIQVKYGFILGQISGLSNAVSKVTATVADQSKTNAYTLAYNERYADWEATGNYIYNGEAQSSQMNDPVYIPLSENVDFSQVSSWTVSVDGVSLSYDSEEEAFTGTHENTFYNVSIYENDPSDHGIMLFVSNTSGAEEIIIGTFNLVINGGEESVIAKLYELSSSQGYALEVSAFEDLDVGDSYNVNVYITEVTQSFKTAVEMVLEESGGSGGAFIVEMAFNSETGNFETDKTAGEIGDAAKTSAIIVHLTEVSGGGEANIYAPIGYDPSSLYMYIGVAQSYFGGVYELFALNPEDTNTIWVMPD